MKPLIFTAFLVLASLIGQTQSKNFIDRPYLEVTGSADTLVTPNEIFIKIIIQEKDTKGKEPVEELERKMYDALQHIGLKPEEDLTTNDMTSNFKFYFLKNKDILKSKQYILKVSDAVTASKVFIALEDIGISNTSIERVDHSDLEGIKNQMRSKAVENAKARALALTLPLKQTLGPAIFIADPENYNLGNQLQGRVAGLVVTAYGAKKQGIEEPPKIEFEKIKISTNISVKFILNP